MDECKPLRRGAPPEEWRHADEPRTGVRAVRTPRHAVRQGLTLVHFSAQTGLLLVTDATAAFHFSAHSETFMLMTLTK